jgi:hypothetical protein
MTTDHAPDHSPKQKRGFPFGTTALLGMAGFFYINMLLNIRSFHGGEGGLGDAIAWFMFTAALWGTLTILLIVGGVMGSMPRPMRWALLALQPLAGAGILVSGDFYSRHIDRPMIEPVLLPLLIAGYAVWARFPALHVKFSPASTSYAVWGSIGIVSIISLVVAANY